MNTQHQAIQSDLFIGLGHFTFKIVTAHTLQLGHFELPGDVFFWWDMEQLAHPRSCVAAQLLFSRASNLMVLIQKGRTEHPESTQLSGGGSPGARHSPNTTRKASCWAGCFLLGVSWAGCRADIFFVRCCDRLTCATRTCVYPCLLFSSRKSTLNCDIFGHERDLGCVFESPFFKRKST